jgi:hypothetical protein
MEDERKATIGTMYMKLTNDSYVILMGTKNFTERYYRDKTGWLKVSSRGRKFRMTAEQVLNHVLPALAGIKRNLTIKVEHHAPLFQSLQETSYLLRSPKNAQRLLESIKELKKGKGKERKLIG